MRPAFPIRIGDVVRIAPSTFGIIEVIEQASLPGEVVVATRAFDDGFVEVAFGSGARLIPVSAGVEVTGGDRVVIDRTGSIVLESLGREDGYDFSETTGVTWDDIGGLEEAKEALREAIELPYQHREIFERYGKRAPAGALLYGPPGCGKTMLAKAAATSLARTHGVTDGRSGFLYVKGPEILNKYVGETESTIRALFARAREHREQAGYPALLFIDEADAILGTRGDRRLMGMEATVVPQFLAEMDGLVASGTFVLLATNRPDALDPAIVRDGRIDRKVRVSRPTYEEAVAIAKLYLAKKPLDGIEAEEAARQCIAKFFLRPYYDIVLKDGAIKQFTLGDLLSGAMLANFVEMATMRALKRDMRDGVCRGISVADLDGAADALHVANVHLDHAEAITHFLEPFRERVAGVTRVKSTEPPAAGGGATC